MSRSLGIGDSLTKTKGPGSPGLFSKPEFDMLIMRREKFCFQKLNLGKGFEEICKVSIPPGETGHLSIRSMINKGDSLVRVYIARKSIFSDNARLIRIVEVIGHTVFTSYEPLPGFQDDEEIVFYALRYNKKTPNGVEISFEVYFSKKD